MKCVKHPESGEIKRVPDPAKYIKAGWVYCSKEEWRQAGRPR